MLDAANNKEPLSVSAAMAMAKSALESFTVTLVGEVSEINNKAGYKAVYFTLKDQHASLPARMWANRFQAAGVKLSLGMLVQVTGRFTLWAEKGRMNFDVLALSVAGEGDLRQRVANLAKKLQAEGLMDPARKRPIPSYPLAIGVATSPRGAAIRDVLRTLRRRFPAARVYVAGVPVEGASAPKHLSEAIGLLAASGAELILLVRGGGSFEDLMPFNDEGLARCIAASPIPVITGIGHEPDNSIADMVADYRASTPTAAAEAVVPNALDLEVGIVGIESRLQRILLASIERENAHLRSLASRPVLADGSQLFATQAQSLDVLFDRVQKAIPGNVSRDIASLSSFVAKLEALAPRMLSSSMFKFEQCGQNLGKLGGTLLSEWQAHLGQGAARLEDLSPLSVMGRGYSYVKDSKGSIVKSIDGIKQGDMLAISVSDGRIEAQVRDCAYEDRETVSWKDVR